MNRLIGRELAEKVGSKQVFVYYNVIKGNN
jgi:hypothetical protein